ncbi:F-box-like domain protein, partial [Rhizoctonia solani AG-3 Rhs1AP]
MSEREELKNTGALLVSALDRYIDANSVIRNGYLERDSLVITPPGHPSHVESELQFVEALELKLQTLERLMKQTRNCSTTLVLIHKLPSELLARIFQFVFEPRPKTDWRSCPETISRVCTRWRNLSISLPALWRRIDLPFIRIIDKSLVVRGRLFASRAHPLPLDVSLYAPYTYHEVYGGSSIQTLVQKIAPHIGSLELDTHWKECNLILSSFLPKCKPGVLKTLTMCHDSPTGMFFDAPTGHRLPAYLSLLYTDIEIGGSAAERAEFDRVLASLTTLRLTGFYPFWTSQAYHGLIELRLLRGSLRPDKAVISEDHLIGILRASPALRILEFSLTIVEALFEDSSISPISLEDLESLSITQVADNKLGALLRWVAPGLKPFQLVINLNPDRDVELLDDQVTSFFARSQVSEIYTEANNHETVIKLLNLCPRLQTLACSHIRDSQPLQPEQDDPIISHATLRSLWIVHSSLDTARLLNIIKGSPALREILIWRCLYEGRLLSSPLYAGHVQAMAELGPKVKTIDHDPTRNWEISVS